jgi:hypothetical protein
VESTFRENLAWAAGFFDGEGHTSVNNYDYVKVDVAQVDRVSLERLREATGVGIISGPFTPKKGRPYFVYRIHGYERVQYFIAVLWPWLGPEKRAQARAALLRDRPIKRRRSTLPEGAQATENACKRGHPRDVEGWKDKAGKWHCRKCVRDNARRRRGSTGVGYIEARRLKGLDHAP